MSGVKWAVEVDSKRECYRILTSVPVQEHDGVKERQWIADVFEQSDAIAISESHNAALDAMEENGSSHNNARDEICPQCTKYALIIRDNYKLCTKCGYVSISGQTSPVA